MKITDKELETIFKLFIENTKGCLRKNEFDLSYSTFWVIMFRKALGLEPGEPTVADLRDDLERLLQKAHEKDVAFTINDYESLGNVIKALGQAIYKEER